MRLALENELKLLRKLQEFDLEIDDIHERSELLHASLEEQDSLHSKLSEALETQRAKLEETRSLARQKELELQENSDHSHTHKDKQARVSSARELSAIEKEIDSLRRRRAQLEEEFETLTDAVTDAEEDVAEKQEKVDELAAELAKQRKTVDAEAGTADNRIAKLEKDRDKLKKEFVNAQAIIARYEFIRARLPGRVIVVARDGACTGCNMVVPPQTYNELIDGKKVIQCPNCKRILYYDDGVVE